jgi:hypothetical protein
MEAKMYNKALYLCSNLLRGLYVNNQLQEQESIFEVGKNDFIQNLQKAAMYGFHPCEIKSFIAIQEDKDFIDANGFMPDDIRDLSGEYIMMPNKIDVKEK